MVFDWSQQAFQTTCNNTQNPVRLYDHRLLTKANETTENKQGSWRFLTNILQSGHQDKNKDWQGMSDRSSDILREGSDVWQQLLHDRKKINYSLIKMNLLLNNRTHTMIISIVNGAASYSVCVLVYLWGGEDVERQWGHFTGYQDAVCPSMHWAFPHITDWKQSWQFGLKYFICFKIYISLEIQKIKSLVDLTVFMYSFIILEFNSPTGRERNRQGETKSENTGAVQAESLRAPVGGLWGGGATIY